MNINRPSSNWSRDALKKNAKRLKKKEDYLKADNDGHKPKKDPETKEEYDIRMHNINSKRMEERRKSQPSIGEARVMLILKRFKIKFEREYVSMTARANGYLVFYDFYLPDYRTVIEYDGPHHLKPVFGPDKFEKQKYLDALKDRFCVNRNIQMLRISYKDFNKMENIIKGFLKEITPLPAAKQHHHLLSLNSIY